MFGFGFSGGGLARRNAASVPSRTPRVAALGDSIFRRNNGTSTTNLDTLANGELAWARAFAPRFLFHSVLDNALLPHRLRGLNHGVDGDTTAQVLARLPAVVAARPDLCLVSAGANDVGTSVTGDTTKANLSAILDGLAAAAIPVVLFTIRPRTDASFTPGSVNRKKLFDLNAWIRNVAGRRPGVVIFDAWAALTDPASPTGEPLPGALDDGVHPSLIGGLAGGRALAALLARLIPGPDLSYAASPDDLYDAALNPFGNLLPNPGLGGTGGTKANGVSGNVATGWDARRSAPAGAATGAASLETPASGPLQRLDLTLPGGGGAEFFQLQPQAEPPAGVAAGTWVQGACFARAELSAGACAGFYLDVVAKPGGFRASAMRAFTTSLTRPLPPGTFEGWFVTEPFQVPPGTTTWAWSLTALINAGVTGTAKVWLGAPSLRAVPDPTTGPGAMFG